MLPRLPSCVPCVDGRTGSRERRHRALVDAARSLATEHGAAGFTVDQVATLAGVSRRTVFNHFGGVDQLLVAVCEQILDDAVEDLVAGIDRHHARPAGHDDDRDLSVMTAVEQAARDVDLATAIATIHHALGLPVEPDERAEQIAQTAFAHVGDRLRAEIQQRSPDLDPLDLELGLVLLTTGIGALARLWIEQHPDIGPDVPTEARAEWEQLMDRLLHRLRVGHTR